MKLRILFITERFKPDLGGLAQSASRIAQNLCSLAAQVDVVTWSRFLQPGEIINESLSSARESRPQIYRIGLYRHWDLTMIHTLNLLHWLQQQNSYHLIWGHYLFPAGFLAVWFAKLHLISSVVSARGNDVDRNLFPPGDFARLQWTLQNVTLITSVSQELATKINLISSRQDIIVLHNAIDTNIFTPQLSQSEKLKLRQELGIDENEIVLGFSGELRQKKGQQFLLSALARVKEERPACLLIIGEVRPSQDSNLQMYALQHPEAYQRLIITHHLEAQQQVAQYLQLCDLFLLPSIWEGLPNALLEAMACSCCCLASDAGGIPEIIEHGVNGFLLPRHQLSHLGDAILEFCALNPELKRQIGRQAREHILSYFSLETEKQNLQQVLDRLLSNC
jgi:glycosyltransferase involved in cell wall biosynthesis